MRVTITGTCDAAIALRGLVQRDQQLVLDAGAHADIIIAVLEGPVPAPTIDGIDTAVELRIHQQLGQQSPSRRVITKFDPNRKPTGREITVILPQANAAESHAAERAIYQALLKVATADGSEPPKRKWFGLLALLLVLGLPAAAAAQAGAVAVRDSATKALVPNIGDSVNQALRVYCVGGTCSGGGGGGGGTSIADRAVFTFGTTNLTPIGGVFDDTPPAILTTGMAAALRLTAFRAGHANLRDASGNEIASATSAPAGSERALLVRNIPSGTQAVSGTVTATLPANSGIDIGDVTVNNAAGASAVNVQDGGNSLTVDGTVAISGTVPISAAALPLPTGAATEATLSSVDGKLPALSGGRIPVELPAGGSGLTDTELRATPVPVSGTVTAIATNLDIRDMTFAADKVDASGTTLGANSGVDVGDVTINNAAGAAAVNIQDGGNSITVDGSLTTVSTVTNLSQLNGTAIAMNTGVRSAGTQRVTVATDDQVRVALYDSLGNALASGTGAGSDSTRAYYVRPTGAATFGPQSAMFTAATANGNGTPVDAFGYSTFVYVVNCSACAGGTTVSFEGSINGTAYTAIKPHLVGSSTFATSTTTAGITQWEISAAGFFRFRAVISGYSSGTVTVTGAYAAIPMTNAVAIDGADSTIGTITNLSQMGGQSIAMGTGVRSAGTQRVTIATDDTVPVTGTFWQATQPVSIATLPALAAGANNIGDVDVLTLPSVTVGTFPDNEPFNVAQINGVTPLMGNGASGTGAMRVSIANDSTGVLASVGSITNALPAGNNNIGDVDIASEIPGTGATNLGKAEDAAVGSGDTGVSSLYQRRDTASVLTSAETEYSTPTVDAYGAVRVTTDHVNRIKCYISSTATTSTLVTGCAAPGASLSIYITSMQWSSSIISTTVNFMRIQSGTGGACGTATTVLWDGFNSVAFGGRDVVFGTPLKLTANHEVCFVYASAGTRLVEIQGFIAP